MFVNKDKKVYSNEFVVENLKGDNNIDVVFQTIIEIYHHPNVCNQFLSTFMGDFEVISNRGVKGLRDGFYVVDKNYTSKFTKSSFIKRKMDELLKKEYKSNTFFNTYNRCGETFVIPQSKKIDKYFIDYIKTNTIIFYTYDEFVDEFNPLKPKPSNRSDYTPHTKSQHTVNGFWRNQPYGSRENPQYKPKWIENFQRGGKKVG